MNKKAAFSAALSRGLIEARLVRLEGQHDAGFSAALSRGLIEARRRFEHLAAMAGVFRGFKPRPH